MVSTLEFNTVMVLQHGQDKFAVLPSLLTEKTLGIGYRKNDSELGIWLTTYLAKIKQDGTFRRIENKWFRDPKWLKEL